MVWCWTVTERSSGDLNTIETKFFMHLYGYDPYMVEWIGPIILRFTSVVSSSLDVQNFICQEIIEA